MFVASVAAIGFSTNLVEFYIAVFVFNSSWNFFYVTSWACSLPRQNRPARRAAGTVMVGGIIGPPLAGVLIKGRVTDDDGRDDRHPGSRHRKLRRPHAFAAMRGNGAGTVAVRLTGAEPFAVHTRAMLIRFGLHLDGMHHCRRKRSRCRDARAAGAARCAQYS